MNSYDNLENKNVGKLEERSKKISSTITSSSLIVVSNRLPFVLCRRKQKAVFPLDEDEQNNASVDVKEPLYRKPSAGGLVTAVAPVMVQSGGLWVGWPGLDLNEMNNETVPESDPEDTSPTAGLKSKQILCVNLDKKDYNLYYNGCCNATYWPLFHSMPDRAIFKEVYWQAYRNVNEKFAAITLDALRRMLREKPKETPIVWIHDYHLMVAANTVRQVAAEEKLPCKIGFFLHIPFPQWDIFKIFPWEDQILQGILACDLVGFHINDYCLNFLDCCQRSLGLRVDRRSMLAEHGGRTVRIRALPIGIPFSTFETMAQAAPPKALSLGDIKIILGIDRLDYTKGLPNRLLTYERFLELYPEYIEKVMLLQVAVPSRTDVKEYNDLKDKMDQLVGEINGRFSTPRWSPIRYIFGCINQNELAGYYRDADVALVTPMRDGMNLVAKEFVACKVNKENPGVLILSPFAGAGDTMHEALRVNPYELGNGAQVLKRALTMPLEEREARMNALRTRERTQDVNFWMKSFLRNIGTALEENLADTEMPPVTMDDFNSYLSPYVGDQAKLALLLDYDGTLTPICKHPDLAVIPTETKKVLERLANRRDVFVAIISGRSVANVKEMVGIEGITYAGNHGMEINNADGTTFTQTMSGDYQNKLMTMLNTLNREVCFDGAWVENKGVLMTYHYRQVPHEKREALIEKTKKLIVDGGFKVGIAHCALEIKPVDVTWDKGRAAIYILRNEFGHNWSGQGQVREIVRSRVRVIFAGDDVTDEDAMRALKGMAMTFRICDSNAMTKTCADKRLPSTDSVVTLLKWIERHMSTRNIQQPQ